MALQLRAKRLVGFEPATRDSTGRLRLLADPEELATGAGNFTTKNSPSAPQSRTDIRSVIFAGDVGTGKTVTAEGACDRLARESPQGGDALQTQHPRPWIGQGRSDEHASQPGF